MVSNGIVRLVSEFFGVEQPEPPLTADEATSLHGSLERQRATFLWKISGVDQHSFSTVRVGSSSITLAGLTKHLAFVEGDLFRRRFLGQPLSSPWDASNWKDDPNWEWTSAAHDSKDDLVSLWKSSVSASRAIYAQAISDGGLEQLGPGTFTGGYQPSLRRLMLDVIEEYARHVGHADLIRESIDGVVGEDPPWPFSQ